MNPSLEDMFPKHRAKYEEIKSRKKGFTLAPSRKSKI